MSAYDRRVLSVAAAVTMEAGPCEAVTIAAGSGWPATGLWFEPDVWTPKTVAEVRRRLSDTGVVCLDLEPVIFSEQGDPGEALVDAAAEIGARHVLVASRLGDVGEEADRFATLCDRAAPAGITLVFEFLPIFPMGSLDVAGDVVRRAGRPNSGVLVDSLHLARSGGTPADVAAAMASGTSFPYLQIADAPADPPDPSPMGLLDEALRGRVLPGEGALPLDELIGTVSGVPLSYELRSRTLTAAYPDPFERARALYVAVSSQAWS
jgi:sugar phosphate isomerase/epimerase